MSWNKLATQLIKKDLVQLLTIIKQQQRQKNGHPFLFNCPIPQWELLQSVCKKTLQEQPNAISNSNNLDWNHRNQITLIKDFSRSILLILLQGNLKGDYKQIIGKLLMIHDGLNESGKYHERQLKYYRKNSLARALRHYKDPV